MAQVSALGAALALALAGLFPGNNPDTFGHLAQGRQIAELGRVPALDTWSLLPGPPRPWHNYEWLSDLGTYLLFSRFGYEAVTLFKCALSFVAALCLARVARELAGPRAMLWTSLVVVSTIPAIRIRLSDRPHVLGICLAAVYLLLLLVACREQVSRHQRTLLVAALGALHLIWVNAHGSHLLGLAITGSFALLGGAHARRPLLAALALQLGASCISPYGPAIVLDAIDHVTDSRYRALVSEWLPWRDTDPAWLQIGPALHGALLTLLASRLLRNDRRARAVLPVALLLGIASFRSIRFVAEFMLLTSPLIGVGLATLSARLAPRRLAAAVSCCALLLVPAVYFGARALPPDIGLGVGVSYAQLPRAAGALLRGHGAAPRMLAAMQDAWFTMYAAPNTRFAIDGRVPFYGPDHVRRVSRAFESRHHFDALVRELDVNTVLVRHTAVEDRSLTAFAASSGFQLVMVEDLHALYVRGDALTPDGTAAFPPLRALAPSYELGWLLALRDAQRADLARELARLATLPGTSVYRGWVEGVLMLAPLRRGGPSDGFRWPKEAEAWQRYRRALPLIARAAESFPSIPTVTALHAEVATALCRFDEAEGALERALSEEASREPLLVAQELALRRGDREGVREVVARARATAQGKNDPWLDELWSGLDAPPSCPNGERLD